MYDRGAPRFDAMHLSLCAAVEQPPTIDVLVELGENARQIDCAAGPVPCWLKKRAPNEGAAARRSGAKARCAVARSIFAKATATNAEQVYSAATSRSTPTGVRGDLPHPPSPISQQGGPGQPRRLRRGIGRHGQRRPSGEGGAAAAPSSSLALTQVLFGLPPYFEPQISLRRPLILNKILIEN